MKTARLLVMVTVVLFIAGAALGNPKKGDKQKVSGREATKGASVPSMIVLQTEKMQWGTGPEALPPGASMTVLSGDPSVAGQVFTVRLKFPANYRIAPHTHPSDEHVTVVSGEMRIGHGEKFDATSMQSVPAGGYFAIPANHNHFAMAAKDSVIQLHGVGPFAITYINSADDPRKQR